MDKTFRVGQRVQATRTITEAGGDQVGDEAALFDSPGYIHARAGECGEVEYVDSDGAPTVRFDRTRTATVVGPDEVSLLGAS